MVLIFLSWLGGAIISLLGAYFAVHLYKKRKLKLLPCFTLFVVGISFLQLVFRFFINPSTFQPIALYPSDPISLDQWISLIISSELAFGGVTNISIIILSLICLLWIFQEPNKLVKYVKWGTTIALLGGIIYLPFFVLIVMGNFSVNESITNVTPDVNSFLGVWKQTLLQFPLVISVLGLITLPILYQVSYRKAKLIVTGVVIMLVIITGAIVWMLKSTTLNCSGKNVEKMYCGCEYVCRDKNRTETKCRPCIPTNLN